MGCPLSVVQQCIVCLQACLACCRSLEDAHAHAQLPDLPADLDANLVVDNDGPDHLPCPMVDDSNEQDSALLVHSEPPARARVPKDNAYEEDHQSFTADDVDEDTSSSERLTTSSARPAAAAPTPVVSAMGIVPGNMRWHFDKPLGVHWYRQGVCRNLVHYEEKGEARGIRAAQQAMSQVLDADIDPQSPHADIDPQATRLLHPFWQMGGLGDVDGAVPVPPGAEPLTNVESSEPVADMPMDTGTIYSSSSEEEPGEASLD